MRRIWTLSRMLLGRRVRRGWILKLKSGMSLFTCIWTYPTINIPSVNQTCRNATIAATPSREVGLSGNPGKPWELRWHNLALLWFVLRPPCKIRTHRPIFQRNQNVFHPWGVERLESSKLLRRTQHLHPHRLERLSPIICKVSLPVLSKWRHHHVRSVVAPR